LVLSLPRPELCFVSIPDPRLCCRPRSAASSSLSSKIVPSVLQEPSTDDDRLWGGEGRLRNPSDPRAPSALDMKLFSPDPLRRLGVPGMAPAPPADARGRSPYPELRGVFGLLAPTSMLFCLAESRRELTGLCTTPLRSEVDSEVESGLGGRLETRGAPLGGSGKAPMLETLRNVGNDGCAGAGEAGERGDANVVFNVGIAGVE